MRPTLALALASLLACTGEAKPDDTSDTDTGVVVADRAHPMCDGADWPFPDDLGQSCAMGSNVDLCVDRSADDCSTSACLWHASDPAGVRAYCTVTCDPSDADACPSGFACVVEDCDEVSVCVRTEAPPTGALYTEPTRVSGLTGLPDWVAHGAGGTLYADGSGALSVVRGSEATPLGDLGEVAGVLGVADGGDFVLWTLGSRGAALGRVSGDTLTTRDLAPLRARGGFRTADGLWYHYAYDTSTGSAAYYPFDVATLEDAGEPIVVPDDGATPAPERMYPLREHGFVAVCADSMTDALCVGTSPTDVTVLPATDAVGRLSDQVALDLRRSAHPDDLWLSDEYGAIARFNGTRWIREDALDARYGLPAGIVPLGDGRAIAMLADSGVHDAVYLDGTCWQPLQPGALRADALDYDETLVSGLGQVGDDAVGWVARRTSAQRVLHAGDFR